VTVVFVHHINILLDYYYTVHFVDASNV